MIKFVNFYSSKKGFTLVELSISISIIMLFIFSFSKIGTSLLTKSTSTSETHIFYHLLSDARFAAIANNTNKSLSADTGPVGFNNKGTTYPSRTKTIENYKITVGQGYENVVIKKTK